MSLQLLENGMSAFHQIFTRNIQGTFAIYTSNLYLLAFIASPLTVTLVKFHPSFHYNQITRKYHLSLPTRRSSDLWAPCSVYTVNFICSHSYLRKLHCLG